VHTAVVSKADPGPGYELILRAHTCAFGVNLFDEQIIDQLKKWDHDFGITVLDAGLSSVLIRFNKLPADVNPLLKQFYEFCPNLKAKLSAEQLCRTKTVCFSWGYER